MTKYRLEYIDHLTRVQYMGQQCRCLVQRNNVWTVLDNSSHSYWLAFVCLINIQVILSLSYVSTIKALPTRSQGYYSTKDNEDEDEGLCRLGLCCAAIHKNDLKLMTRAKEQTDWRNAWWHDRRHMFVLMPTPTRFWSLPFTNPVYMSAPPSKPIAGVWRLWFDSWKDQD